MKLETPLPTRPKIHRAQETKAGKVIFILAFRNLPQVLCVPLPEKNFIFGSFGLSQAKPKRIRSKVLIIRWFLNQTVLTNWC